MHTYYLLSFHDINVHVYSNSFYRFSTYGDYYERFIRHELT